MFLFKIKTYGFIGPSGTGKSYRAQMVASEKNIKFIIDDGLLIMDNQVIAGESAKKAPTKIETVKHALFYEEEERIFKGYYGNYSHIWVSQWCHVPFRNSEGVSA